MSRRAAVAALLCACGAAAAPGGPSAPGAAVAVTAPIPVAPISCADAGVLVARASQAPTPAAGDQLAADVAATCTADHWSQAALDCLGRAADPRDRTCLEQLPADAHARVEALLAAAEGGGDADGSAGDAGEPAVTCEQAIGDGSGWPDPSAARGASGDDIYAAAGRKRALVAACEAGAWSDRARLCFAGAHDPVTRSDCDGQLEPAQQAALTDALASEDTRLGKVLAMRAHPAAIACGKVVAAHYADATWKGELAQVPAAARRTAIAHSRARMAKACTAEKWDATTRACLLVDAEDGAACGEAYALWGRPAAGVLLATGIAECDQYLAATVRLADCPGAAPMRAALLSSTTMGSVGLASAAAGDRSGAQAGCKAALDAVSGLEKSYSCTP